MNILEICNVSKSFASHQALDDVSFSVAQGGIHGLLGPNGAGKTTLIRIINHITAPDSGEVILDGHRLCEADVASIGYLPEERGLYKKMKVGDQAMFFARLKGLSRSDASRCLRRWFEKLDIMPWWDKKIEELSKGMAQKIQFIVTVLHQPRLLIFDEPFSGFDPINAKLLKREILELSSKGSTIIFSTHNMASVEEICDSITLINNGRNILTGNVADLRREYFGSCYDLTFSGDVSSLREAVAPLVDRFTLLPPDQSDRSRVTVRMRDVAQLPALITAANEATSLQAFTETLASMSEIFIRAVNRDEAAASVTEAVIPAEAASPAGTPSTVPPPFHPTHDQ